MKITVGLLLCGALLQAERVEFKSLKPCLDGNRDARRAGMPAAERRG
ncbi:MAG: hypothetical protein SFV54_03795 [Bryobacteraceae bacterium]|nr:hypothetical protein [Bryobacteraceae bacterium]